MERSTELIALAQRGVEEEMERFNVTARSCGVHVEVATLKTEIVNMTMLHRRLNEDSDLWYILSRKIEYCTDRLDEILWHLG